MIGNIILTLFLLFFVVFVVVFGCSRFWYPAQIAYHYVFEHRDYLHFRAAQKQLKDKGSLALTPLTYYCYSGLYDVYGKAANVLNYHLMVINGHLALYAGDDVVITNFGGLMLDKLFEQCKYDKTVLYQMQLLENDCNLLGYTNFIDKYITKDYDEKIGLTEFMTRYLKKKREEVFPKEHKAEVVNA